MSKQIHKIPFFDYLRQLKNLKNEINQAVTRVLNSGRLILGDEVKKFENDFSRYIGVKYAIGVNSGTDAIKIALRALSIGFGDEVITVANTAVPTVSAIRETGAKPVFVDIKDDYNIDENKVEQAITKKTKAILPVHLYGQPSNLPALLKIAKKYKLKLIEDCAQAHGAKINKQLVGSFGDLGCFSFYPTKNLGAFGDGGLIVTANKFLADNCRSLRFYGMKKNYFALAEGYNSRLDELQAAILNTKLKYLGDWLAKRQNIAAAYLANIKNKKIQLPAVNNLKSHAFHLFVIRVKQRQKMMEYLDKNMIGYGIHYPDPIHLQTAYHFLGYRKGSLPKTEKFAKEILSLPIFPELINSEVEYIIDKLNKF